MRARVLDGCPDLRLLVDRQVVEHDNIARSQGRHQHLVDVGKKLELSIGPSNTAGAPTPSRRSVAITVCICQ